MTKTVPLQIRLSAIVAVCLAAGMSCITFLTHRNLVQLRSEAQSSSGRLETLAYFKPTTPEQTLQLPPDIDAVTKHVIGISSKLEIRIGSLSVDRRERGPKTLSRKLIHLSLQGKYKDIKELMDSVLQRYPGVAVDSFNLESGSSVDAKSISATIDLTAYTDPLTYEAIQ